MSIYHFLTLSSQHNQTVGLSITNLVLCRNSQDGSTATTGGRKTASKIATNGSLTMNKKVSSGGGAALPPPARQTLVNQRLWPEEGLEEDTVDDVENQEEDTEHYATLRSVPAQ